MVLRPTSDARFDLETGNERGDGFAPDALGVRGKVLRCAQLDQCESLAQRIELTGRRHHCATPEPVLHLESCHSVGQHCEAPSCRRNRGLTAFFVATEKAHSEERRVVEHHPAEHDDRGVDEVLLGIVGLG